MVGFEGTPDSSCGAWGIKAGREDEEEEGEAVPLQEGEDPAALYRLRMHR